jgi:hypothetical protein
MTTRFDALCAQGLINGIIANWESAEKPVSGNATYQDLANIQMDSMDSSSQITMVSAGYFVR